jgi:hypothetical protein
VALLELPVDTELLDDCRVSVELLDEVAADVAEPVAVPVAVLVLVVVAALVVVCVAEVATPLAAAWAMAKTPTEAAPSAAAEVVSQRRLARARSRAAGVGRSSVGEGMSISSWVVSAPPRGHGGGGRAPGRS